MSLHHLPDGRGKRCTNWVIALLLGLCAPLTQAASLAEVSGFGSNPGNLRMFKYVPDNLAASRPLVVALHGCRQSADDYDDETGWVKFAEQWRFALLLPEQQDVNNLRRCFNWFNGHRLWFLEYFPYYEPGSDMDRDEGEALSIRQMIERMKTDHRLDAKRIFATGLSAGGAMTAVMLAAYPDTFAGGAIVAGVPYKCALGTAEALSSCGVDLNAQGSTSMKNLAPSQWGSLVRGATKHRGPWPRVSIWQGSADKTVSPDAETELVEQWTNVHGIDQTPAGQDTVKGYPHKVYKDANGNALVESYTITGMGHGVPVDPGSGEDQCGKAGDFVLDAHICASYYIGKFWGLDKTP